MIPTLAKSKGIQREAFAYFQLDCFGVIVRFPDEIHRAVVGDVEGVDRTIRAVHANRSAS